MKFIICFLLLFSSLASQGQGRRLPNFSFGENSIEFADANRDYNDNNQFTDTIHDGKILNALLQIMEKNPKLVIQVLGHTAMNEDTLLGQQRADTVVNFLLNNGIDSSRVTAINKGYSAPIISEAIIGSLPTAIEVDAANQKNRRAEVKILAVKEDE